MFKAVVQAPTLRDCVPLRTRSLCRGTFEDQFIQGRQLRT